MPAYNGERYIAESIRSAINQTYQNWELIVIDDGSTDRTADIVREFQSTDRRLVYLFQPNGRQGRARNTGIRHAKGELIAFLDQDDLWVEKKLDLQLKAIDETGADVIFSDGYIFQNDAVSDEAMPLSAIFGRSFGRRFGEAFFNQLFAYCRVHILSALVRKSAILKVGGLEEGIRCQNCEDYELWLRLASNGAVFYGMNEKLVRYRKHPDQASDDSVQMLRSEIAVVEKYLHLPCIDAKLKRERVRSLYRNLAIALVNKGRPTDAKKSLQQLLLKEKGWLTPRLQIIALRVLPGRYKIISNQLYRIEASLSYRVVRPITRAWEKLQLLFAK